MGISLKNGRVLFNLLSIWSFVSFSDNGVCFVSESDHKICKYMTGCYVCEGIPRAIPQNITCVVVRNFLDESLVHEFDDHSWGRATKLDLTAKDVDIVSSKVFVTLSKLEELTLTLPSVQIIQPRAFSGLFNLKKLVLLSMSIILPKPGLFAAISDNSLQYLEELTFDTGSVDLRPSVFISTATAKTTLAARRLSSLNISNTLIGTTAMALLTIALSNINVLNVSGSTISMIGAQTSDNATKTLEFGTQFYTDKSRNPSAKIRPIFNTLEMSGSKYSDGPFKIRTHHTDHQRDVVHRWTLPEMTFHRYFTLIEHLYADDIFHRDVGFDTSYNYSGSPVFWKTISCRGNRIRYVSGDLMLGANNTLYYLDWSNNKIAYCSRGSIHSMIHLKWLNVSTNRLGQMERTNKDEFRQLLKPLKELILLDLAHNVLSDIPYDMFEENTNLETLNLGYNKLTTVMFRLMTLVKLRRLDLSGNQIRVLNGEDFSRLKRYVAFKQQNTSDVFALDLKLNPIACDCESKSFIEWLSVLSDSIRPRKKYYCQLDGKSVAIDQSAVDKSKFLCIRTLIIITSTTVSVALILIIVCITLGLIRRQRRRKQRDREYRFAKAFHDGKMKEEFMAFIAYASLEEDMARQHLLRPLNNALQTKLRVQRDTVATGHNFTPGFRITEETFRLIDISHVFIAVVSNSFCQSEYCLAELHEACNQKKPVILAFVGEVEENNMSPYLREVFKRVVRVKIEIGDDEEVNIVPSIEKLCDSVIQLAMRAKN